jgi:membrane associated rhomboid family serine protease
VAEDENNRPRAGSGAEPEEDDDDGGLRQRWATLVLVGLNAAVFLAGLLAGESPIYAIGAVMAGGVEPSRVWDGELWRLVTACFIHLGIWHLGLNAWVLWQLGPVLERFIGGSRVLLLYVSSGVFGFALSLALRASASAGASGAIFGITGALIAVALMLRKDERSAQGELGRLLLGALLPFVVATLVLGFMVPNAVDNTAHVGGLLFGLIAGYGLSAGDTTLFASPSTTSVHARWRGTAALVTSALLFVVVTMYAARPLVSPHYHAVRGLDELRQRGPSGRGLTEAKAHASDAARLGPDDASTFVLLGRIRIEGAAAGAAGDVDRTEGARLVREGLRRADVSEAPEEWSLVAFMDIVRELSLGGGTDEMPFSDLRTVDALCDAALAEHEERAPRAPAGELKNTCAWLWLKAADASVRDPARALAVAREAVADTKGENASIVHTLAEALAQNGQPGEGLAHLEKLATNDMAGDLPGGRDFLDAERRRLKRLASSAAPSAAPSNAAASDSPVPSTGVSP